MRINTTKVVMAKIPPKSYREIQYDNMLSQPEVSLRELPKLAWNGIPPYHRPTVWKMLVKYLPTKVRRRAKYLDAVRRHYESESNWRDWLPLSEAMSISYDIWGCLGMARCDRAARAVVLDVLVIGPGWRGPSPQCQTCRRLQMATMTAAADMGRGHCGCWNWR